MLYYIEYGPLIKENRDTLIIVPSFLISVPSFNVDNSIIYGIVVKRKSYTLKFKIGDFVLWNSRRGWVLFE